jgi:hypothetical protein
MAQIEKRTGIERASFESVGNLWQSTQWSGKDGFYGNFDELMSSHAPSWTILRIDDSSYNLLKT